MRATLTDLPWFLPGLALSILVALIVSAPLARWLGATRPVAALLVVGVGAVLAATIPPDGSGTGGGGGCDLGRIGFASLREYLAVNETSLNVALFVPLGVALALLPGSRRTTWLLTAGLLAPFAIEATQLLVPALGRGCQSADVVDNLLGLVLGFGAARIGLRALRGRVPRVAAPPEA